MSNDTLVVVIILGLIMFAAFLGVFIYNRLVRSRVRTREAWSGIDVQLKRRASLIPNIVETVKGYAAHERGVFEEVTRARSALREAGSASEAANANNVLTKALGRLFAVVENYPQLQASKNFQALQEELSAVEEKIAFARQFYNRNVADFNTRIMSIPDVVIAGMFGFKRFDFFEVEEEAREDVHVNFAPPVGQPSPKPPPPPES
jgi:LemA protein